MISADAPTPDVTSQASILRCEGEFDQQTTLSILNRVEYVLHDLQELPGTKRKVLNVAIEALQNLVRHQKKGILAGQQSFFVISKNDTRYCIMTGNTMEKKKAVLLTGNLEAVNNEGKAGLRKKYMEALRAAPPSQGNGAGLGLMHMARRSGEKLLYGFCGVNPDHTFFWLKVNLARTNMDSVGKKINAVRAWKY